MIDCSDCTIEWNVCVMQRSMQEFGEEDPLSLASSVLTHSLTAFPSADDLEVPEDSTALVVRESMVPKINVVNVQAVPDTAPILSLQEVQVMTLVSTHAYYLHTMIFRGEVQLLRRFLAMQPGGLSTIINETDHRGNTPLMLAVKLSHLSAAYYTVARMLLAKGADPRKKDANGWSPLDEAMSKGDRDIVGLLFDHLYSEKCNKLEAAKRRAIAALQRLPDFYAELKWEFDSAVIPLVSRLAPHDVCRIWKAGNAVRLDMTLVGWKKLRSKRRNISLFFRPTGEPSHRDFVLVNHSKEVLVFPLEPLDHLEREAVISDLLRGQAVKGEFRVDQCAAHPVTNWSGKQVTAKVGPWHCRKLEIQVHALVNYTKRITTLFSLRETDYFSNITGHATKPTHAPIADIPQSPRQPTAEDSQLQKKGRLLVWLTQDFPITLRDFLPVLEMLAPGNSALQRMFEILKTDAFAQHFSEETFPVRLEVPLSMTIKAQATFLKMELGPVGEEVMRVPDYPNESRRVAQKTLTSPKKRLVFANIAA